MTLYVGNNDAVTQKVKKAYIGVDGIGRNIKAMYVGDDNGIARKVFPDGGPTVNYVIFSHDKPSAITLRIPIGYQYSLDNGGTWLDSNNTDITSTNTENEIWVKYKTARQSSNTENIGTGFSSNGNVKVTGKLIDLIGENTNSNGNKEYHAQHLFKGGKIYDASKLIFPNYTCDSCCANMFDSATNLAEPPLLPSNHAARYCYQEMFAYCKNLSKFPTLPATSLEEGCYFSMMNSSGDNITSLEGFSLPATTLAKNCYGHMFGGCKFTSVGNFTLPAPIMEESCYEGMFSGCRKLEAPPILPSTELAESCYKSMFHQCFELHSFPELPATITKPKCYRYMFEDAGSDRQPIPIPKNYLSHMILSPYCFEGMFAGTTIKMVPDLPCTSLEEGCYSHMFYHAIIQKSAVEDFILPSTSLAPDCYSHMFDGTAYSSDDWSELSIEYMPAHLISNMHYVDIPDFAFEGMYFDAPGLGNNLYFCDAYDDPDPEYGEYNFILNVSGDLGVGAIDEMFGCSTGDIYPETDMMDSDGTPLVTNEPIGYYWD